MLRKMGTFVVVERANDDLCYKNIKNTGLEGAKSMNS